MVGHSVENTKIYCQTQRKNRENVHFTEFFPHCERKFFIFPHCVGNTDYRSTSVCSVPLRSLKEGIMLLPIRGWNGDLCANFAPLCLDKNGFESLKIVYLVSKAQCGNLSFFLIRRFYVKSILRIVEIQNLPCILTFLQALNLNFGKFQSGKISFIILRKIKIF